MENVIVVTMNYRLHTLGFLMLPSLNINGNAGLKDQQMALEWVYENISNFNGDPEKICLFGESAGAASVHLQVLNEKSRKMIKGAICQSGCGLGDWVIQRDGIGRTKKLAQILGCESQDDNDIYETVMNAPLKELFRKGFAVNPKDEKRRNLNFVFKPVIERESSDAFMTKSPVELIKQQKIDIPIIFGTCDKDGMIQTAFMMKIFNRFNEDPVRMVPLSLNINPDSEVALEVGKEVKKFYFGDELIDKNQVENFNDLMTDIHFLIPQTIANELHAKYQKKSKQYLYEFRFDGDLNLYKQILQMDFCKGACHADDLFYLFGYAFLFLLTKLIFKYIFL
jgi:carboxylesterase type B